MMEYLAKVGDPVREKLRCGDYAGAASRFPGDYLTGDKYFRIDYPEHNLVRARAQPALFRDMMLHMKDKLQSTDDQCAVELWRYDPRKLACGNCVDKLSLALALSADRDERIEEAVEEMLTSVWEELNGKRN